MKEALLYQEPTIYIADDDEDDVYFVRAALKEVNSEIKLKHFQNGKKLLDGLSEKGALHPHFILLDLNMPILDGRETLRIIRQEMKQALPIIILSTSSHDHEKELCFEYGATSYFTKPCNYAQYREIVKKLTQEWIHPVSIDQ